MNQNPEIKEHSMSFRADMLKALLEDRKTRTARLITARNSTVNGYKVTEKSKLWQCLDWSRVRFDRGPHILHPSQSGYLHVGLIDNSDIYYRVRPRIEIGDIILAKKHKFEVTDVFPERLQDISEEDAVAEGVESINAFASLWDSIYGAGSWDLNQLVWVIEFGEPETAST
jgi:hypothetical protein